MANHNPQDAPGQPLTIIQKAGDRAIQIAQNFGKVVFRYTVFSDVRQVLVFLITVVSLGSIAIYFYWLSRQPEVMTKDFNIAVAEFVQTGEGPNIAPMISQRLHNYLDGQYNLSSFETVEVAHKNIGVITSAEEARKLAEKINAHLVIYGDVAVIGEQALISPQFYVVEAHQFNLGELNGEHKLAARINLLINELVAPAGDNTDELEQSTKILVEFTKALVYLAGGNSGDLSLAKEAITQTVAEGENYGDFEGKEAIYLFASDITMRMQELDEAQRYLDVALALNPNYGRGYIAQANIYYQQGNLNAALETYQDAIALKQQPYGSYIQEKAYLGIGNCCNVQFQYVLRAEGADSPNVTELANCALSSYRTVLISYDQQSEPELNLQEMAAWATYSSGLIYQESGQFAFAEDAFNKAVELTSDPELEAKAKERINNLTAK